MEFPRSQPDRRFAEFRRTGDPRALGEVYDALSPELLRLARRMTRDAGEAEDVLQATFVVAIEEAQRFDPARRVAPWLVGILAREARKARERAERRPDPARLSVPASADPEAEAERAELVAALDQGLVRLPAEFRPALQLRLRHGLGAEEIAAVLECAPGTVRSRLARGVALLRAVLPAGLAATILGCDASEARGLGAIRAALLQHAARVRPLVPVASVPVSATPLLGGLLVKALAAVVAVLVSAWLLWNPRSPEVGTAAAELARLEPVPGAVAASVAPEPREPASIPPAQREPAAPARTPEVMSEPPSAGRARLEVLARWPDGSPAAGEIVLVTPSGVRLDDALPVTTESDGIARCSDLDPGWVAVRLLRGTESGAMLRPGETAELALDVRAGVSVAGRVRDQRGEPVSHAAIWLSERYRDNLGHVVTWSDTEGRFALRSLEPEHSLAARHAGFVPSRLYAVSGAPGTSTALDLVLGERATALRGTVVDPEGFPIEGARVLLGRETQDSVRIADGSFVPGPPPERLETDAAGTFASECALPGTQPIQVRASGFAPLVEELEVLPDGPNAFRLVLVPEARLVGTVQRADGVPLAGARIEVGGGESFAGTSTTTDSEGRFVLGGIGDGSRTVRARDQDEGTAEITLVFAPGRTEEWRAVLAHTPRIAGRVLDASGTPQADLVVVALPRGDRERRIRSGPTDDEGRFALDGLDACAHLLWVQPPGGWRVFPLLEVEDVWPDGAELELRLPRESERSRLSLAVTSAAGAPLAHTELLLWHVERRLWRSYTSGADGVIQVENVPPGTLELELRHPDHPWKPLGTRSIAAGEELDLGGIALDPSGRLIARLSGLAEDRLDALAASLVNSASRESGVATIREGAVTSGPLAPDTYTLIVGGDGVRQVRVEFAVQADHDTELALVLEPCGLREVRLGLPGGTRRPNWITGSLYGGTPRGIAWQGMADLAQDPPVLRISAAAGTYRLRVGGAGGLAGELELTVPAIGASLPEVELPLAVR